MARGLTWARAYHAGSTWKSRPTDDDNSERRLQDLRVPILSLQRSQSLPRGHLE